MGERLVDHLALPDPAAPGLAVPGPAATGPAPAPTAEDVLGAVAAWAADRGMALYPAQEEALLEVVTGAHVVLSTPTGSGKSLVAAGAHLAALVEGRRTFYTAPIKALVSEKFFDLCAQFGPERVGMLTGDAAVNAGAPLVCATAEVLANIALRQGAAADVDQVVMDEFHYYADPDRGWAWQVPLIELPRAQFLLMSATLGDATFFRDDLTRRTGRPTAVVTGMQRPVPLHFSYAMTPLHETIAELLATRRSPVYVVHPTQAAAVEQAQALTSVRVCTREEKDAIAGALGAFRFTSGFGATLSRLVRMGIGVHHGGMLPRYRRLVERLTQAGLLKVVCGTDTLGVGVNVPIRTVLLTSLTKFDGTAVRRLSAREFHQVAGRAGRAGYDTAGDVVGQAPEHEIENARLLAKAGDDPRKRRRVVRRRPPEGVVSWSRTTFDRLVDAPPEPLRSSFRVTSAMVLDVVARPGDAFAAMRHLLLDNHEPRAAQRRHVHRAIEVYRALLAAGVVERLEVPDGQGRTVRLTVDLQPDFALHQPLSPFALAALELLDPAAEGYALDVVSVVESTLDPPRQVLAAQRNRARGEAVAAMKAEGLDYEERMRELEDVTYPRPLAELLEAALEIYRRGHPWVADYELTPKSVVREMAERAMTFGEYVSDYGLARTEGVLLRYLAEAYRALRRTVPGPARTEELDDLVEWLGELVRQVDSSLLDEWEALVHPDPAAPVRPAEAERPRPVTGNARGFRVLVRNALFRRVQLAAARRWGDLGDLDADAGFDADAWREALVPYFAAHDEIRTGADARGPALLVVAEHPGRWDVRQILDDPAGDHDWGVTAVVDLAASDEAGVAVVRVTGVGALGGA